MFKALISLFLTAGAGVIFFTESKNYFPEIKVLRKQVSSYNETINTAKKVRISIDKTLGIYNSISQDNVDRINKMVPSGSESMKLVVQIDDMMRKSGLTLLSIDSKDTINNKPVSIGKKNESKTAGSVFLSMKAKGSYESFHSFVEKLEKNLRLADVNSVKINPAGQDDYFFFIEAVSYWRKTGDKI